MAKPLFRLAWIISLPVRRAGNVTATATLAWFIHDSLSVFRLLGGEKGELRVTA